MDMVRKKLARVHVAAKRRPLLWAGVLLIIVGLVLFGFSGEGNAPNLPARNDSTTVKAPTDQVIIDPATKQRIVPDKNLVYTVSINEKRYYGRLSKINDDYIRLTPVAFMRSTTATGVANEVHGSEPYAYFQLKRVTKIEKTTDGKVIAAVHSHTAPKTKDAFGKDDISEYLNKNQYQVILFSDGVILYGKVGDLKGQLLKHNKYVFIARTDAADIKSPSASLLRTAREVYEKRTADEVVMWQNLREDSQTTKAIEKFIKENP